MLCTVTTDGIRTATGGVTLASGTVAAGIFEINSTLAGCEIFPVKIRLSATATLTETGGATMVATNFVSLPAATFTIVAGTPQIVEVGADLPAVAGQVGGTYGTLTPYSIVVRH